MKKIKFINRNSCIKLLAVIFILFMTVTGFAQARAQADENITAVTITAAKPSRPTTTGEFSTSRDQPASKQPLKSGKCPRLE